MSAPHDGARGDARKRHQDPSGAVNAGTPVEPRPAADAAAPGVAAPLRTVPNGAPDEAKEPAVGAAVPAAPESSPSTGHDVYCEGGQCRCFSDVESEDVGTLPDAAGDGANGRLSEAEERFENYLRWHFNVVAEEGKGSAYIGLGIENAKLHLAAIVREHTERALAEHRREWSDYFEHWSGAVGPKPLTVALAIEALRAESVPFGRAARQEQS